MELIKVRYKKATGEIVPPMGSIKELIPADDEAVIEVLAEVPDQCNSFRIINDKELVEKSQPEKDTLNAPDKFNTNVFLLGLFEILPTLSNFNLRLEGSNLGLFCEARNFSGLKQYLNALIKADVCTKDDYLKINNVSKSQGIDLESIQE